MSNPDVMTWTEFAGQQNMRPLLELEEACWAPWLAASPESLEGRARVFPEGQLCVVAVGKLLATVSTNRIGWSGDTASLPTWDQVAGDPTTYEHTYQNGGNTIALMSMNVAKAARGWQLPSLLSSAIVNLARTVDCEHVMGSFRPSAFSKAVLQAVAQGDQPPTFEDYCRTTNGDGLPIDPWLRSLTRQGMQPIAIDPNAMRVPVTQEEFESHKQPDWQEIEIGGQIVWWCGETGFFYPQPDGSYEYRESNLWGRLYEK